MSSSDKGERTPHMTKNDKSVDDGGRDRSKIKCTIERGSHVSPCWALAEVSEGNGAFSGKRKGVMSYHFISMKTGEYSKTLYGIKSGEHALKGLIMNHCPFCGVKINPQLRARKEPHT